jgi:hypothetical protein
MSLQHGEIIAENAIFIGEKTKMKAAIRITQPPGRDKKPEQAHTCQMIQSAD